MGVLIVRSSLTGVPVLPCYAGCLMHLPAAGRRHSVGRWIYAAALTRIGNFDLRREVSLELLFYRQLALKYGQVKE